jgi:hypothetical protein
MLGNGITISWSSKFCSLIGMSLSAPGLFHSLVTNKGPVLRSQLASLLIVCCYSVINFLKIITKSWPLRRLDQVEPFRVKLPSLSLPQIYTPNCFSVGAKDFDREPFYTVIPQSILSGSGNGGVSGHVSSTAALLFKINSCFFRITLWCAGWIILFIKCGMERCDNYTSSAFLIFTFPCCSLFWKVLYEHANQNYSSARLGIKNDSLDWYFTLSVTSFAPPPLFLSLTYRFYFRYNNLDVSFSPAAMQYAAVRTVINCSWLVEIVTGSTLSNAIFSS